MSARYCTSDGEHDHGADGRDFQGVERDVCGACAEAQTRIAARAEELRQRTGLDGEEQQGDATPRRPSSR